MTKVKLYPGLLVLVLMSIMIPACSESGMKSNYLPGKPAPIPVEMPSDELEIQLVEPCSFIIPETLGLQAIKVFPCFNIDDDYCQIHLPGKLCIHSFPPELEGYYIVLFTGPIMDEYKEQIDSLGGTLHSYVPENGFIVKMGEKTVAMVEDLAIVKWVGIYQPAYKISVDVNWSSIDPPVPDVSMPLLTKTGQIILSIGIFIGEDAAVIVNRIESLGGTASTNNGTNHNVVRVLIDAAKIPEIANIPGIEFISEYRIPEISN